MCVSAGGANHESSFWSSCGGIGGLRDARVVQPGRAERVRRPDGGPTTQMLVGPDGIARPYLVQAGQTGFGQVLPGQPYGWSPYTTTTPGAVTPLAYGVYPAHQAPYPVQTQYVTERAVAQPGASSGHAADIV